MSKHLPCPWYPLGVALATATFLGLLGAGAPPVVAAYVPAGLVGIAIALLEPWFTERVAWRPTRADVIADAAFMAVVMIAVPRLLLGAAAIALSDSVRGQETGLGWQQWWPHAWPFWAQFLTMVLVVDFLRYWLHRACHRVPFLWHLHEVHHSPDGLYVLNVGRFHPLEKTLHFALDTLPFALLGVAPQVLAAYFLAYSVKGLFQHSNLKLRYGWLNRVVGSAETHRWHHARDWRSAACNFGNTTMLWDQVFRTWRLPDAVVDVGIPDRQYPKGFLSQMAVPFRRGSPLGRRSALKAEATEWLIGLALRLRGPMARARLARQARDPMRIQRALLARILADNRETAYGRRHGFDRIDGPEAFAAMVPVVDFEALRPHIDDGSKQGKAGLTAEPPVHFLRTSGTTGLPKDVPLTRSHLRSLRRIHRDAISFQHRVCPRAFDGAIFAMASPAIEGWLPGGLPYGSASGVVAGTTPEALQGKFAVPAGVLTIAESRVKYLLALRLAVARTDVTYLSAANPSTLLALVRLYTAHAGDLIADLRSGGFFMSDRVPPALMNTLIGRLAPDPARAEQLKRLDATRQPVRLSDVWPSLRLVVTWTCASAGLASRALRKTLSEDVQVMELGYISSEFRGTIPLGKRSGSGLPTLDTHYFEFAERDAWDAGRRDCLTLDQLQKGHDYYVVVTTPSGLYRYFINDVVRVRGHWHATPLLQFMQKGKGVTSITGEKLYEAQALHAVRDAMTAAGQIARFMMLLADEEARCYRLYVEAEADMPCGLDAPAFAASVDARLAELNLEYAAKRESERLAPLRAVWLREGAAEAYKQHCVARGQREGQFKTIALAYRRDCVFDWAAQALPHADAD